MRTFAIALLVLGAAACAGTKHRLPLLPDPGVDVDVHVHVGKEALRGGAAGTPEPLPSRCCCGRQCHCAVPTGGRS